MSKWDDWEQEPTRLRRKDIRKDKFKEEKLYEKQKMFKRRDAQKQVNGFESELQEGLPARVRN